ncbi:MAG: 4Fe-4S ferredoxin [Promethearchaeota archaeon]|nr:MAG: 4Fe-4S ferredoxin [Candidatus Lokiarchaeota archaeon]
MQSIYYFSGTGNSLYIAKKLAENLDDCELIPVAKAWKEDDLTSKSEKIGLVFPLYYYGLPAIVYDFLDKFDLNSTEYIYAIVTSGAGGSGAALSQVKKLLKKQSKTLNAGFSIKMPANYIPLYDVPSEEKRLNTFEKSEEKLDKCLEIIKAEENKIKREPAKLIGKVANLYFRKKVNRKDKKLFADEKCNSCEICEKICPVNNINMVDGKPQWQHHCQLCLACLHFCPQEAIQYGKRTSKRRRYHHPQIKINEIINQK